MILNYRLDREIMPIDLVKFYSAEIVSALESMFSKGVIHRDLKPENILIAEDYHLKLVTLVHN